MIKVMEKKEKQNIVTLQTPELKNLKVLYFIYAFLIFVAFIMPQYFGVHIGFDITTTRLANILIILYMIFSPKILTHFWKTTIRCEIFLPLGMYLFVGGYTMVLRTDINAFFMIFMEILTLFMLIYGIRYIVGYKRAIKWSIYCAYFLSCYGLVEYLCGESLFLKFLSTVPNTVSNYYRSGHYRIMGPCGHSLGYGLLLILFIALACIDLEKNELFLFKRPVLMVLLYVNVFLTGSRSTLGIAVVEAVVILLFGTRKNIKKSLLILCVFIVLMAVFLLLFYKTDIGQYLLGQIASVIDQVFGTNYAAGFGVETDRLEDSSYYRAALPYIFTLDWLNPIIGRGTNFGGAEVNGVFIHSIDNYYVAQYIKYAYPGMISYVLFMLVFAYVLLKDMIRSKSAVSKAVFIGAVFYFLNLWWVDALQTLKFMYILIAIFYASYLEKKDVRRYNLLQSKQKV